MYAINRCIQDVSKWSITSRSCMKNKLNCGFHKYAKKWSVYGVIPEIDLLSLFNIYNGAISITQNGLDYLIIVVKVYGGEIAKVF